MKVRDYDRIDADETGLVELRVHGVGGTPPEALLKSDSVDLVRGDEVAGFYRPSEPSAPGEPILEAYSWGGLTSKSWTRSMWVLLAPFALVNVAGWMLPEDPGPGGKRRSAHWLTTSMIRVVGLHLTLMVILWVGQITMNFGAFQCGGIAACRDKFGFMDFLGVEYFLTPGRRIALGAAVPILFAVALWLLSRVSRGRYEADYPFTDPVEHTELPDGDADSFADPTMWKRSTSIRRFAELHLAASLAAVAWAITGSLVWLYQHVEPAGLASRSSLANLVIDVVRWGSIAVVIVAVIAIVGRPLVPSGDRPLRSLLDRVVRWLLMASIGLVGAAIVAASVWPAANPAEMTAAGVALLSVPSTALMPTYGAFTALVVFIVALVAHPTRKRSIPSPLPAAEGETQRSVRVGFGGWGALVALLFSYLIALVFLNGIGAGSARFLGGRPLIDYPRRYDAYAIGTVMLVLGLLIAAGLRWWSRRASYPLGLVDHNFPQERSEIPTEGSADREGNQEASVQPSAPGARVRWLKTLQRVRVARIFVADAEPILWVGLVIAFVFIAADFALDLRDFSITDEVLSLTPGWMETASMWVMAVGVPVGAVFVVRRSFSSRTARKSVGILWDVTTLWPRWYHPLAPPSYAGRAVPELRTRLDVLTREGNVVVVSAHSQGSVLAVAALDGLRNEQCIDCLGLITHGSPVGRLYLTYFPSQLRPSISRVNETLNGGGEARWFNLYRLTDPIGGAIGGEADLVRAAPLAGGPPDTFGNDTNPVEDPDAANEFELVAEGLKMIKYFPRPGNPYPKPLGHSDYYASRHYDDVLQAVGTVIARDPPRV